MSQTCRRICVVCLLLLQIIVVFFTSSLVGFADDAEPAQGVDTSASALALGVAHGAHLRPVLIDYGNGTRYSWGDELLAMNSLVGKDMAIIMYFWPWSPFDPFLSDEIQKHVPLARQPVIMLTWEPGPTSKGCDVGYGDGQGPVRSINSGRCDDYIRTFARALKARPERYILRFAHEMNIASSPWWPGHSGMDARSYVDAYRRVRAIFWSEGAANVEWMWSPNNFSNPPDAWNDIHNYYPGDAYVDWIGLSGYNWYGAMAQPWYGYEYLYGDVLKDFACRYPKPVILAEIGSVDGSSDASKAAWVTELYDKLGESPFVRGIVWYNDFAYAARGNADFRVTTGGQDCHDYGGCSGVQPLPGSAGQQTTNAFIASVRKSVYTSKLPSVAQATPPYTLCSAPSQPFSLNKNSVVLRPGGTTSLTVRGFLYSSPAQIALELPSGVRGTVTPTTLTPPWGTANVKLTADAKLAYGTYTGTIKVGSTSLPVTISNLKVRAYIPGVRR